MLVVTEDLDKSADMSLSFIDPESEASQTLDSNKSKTEVKSDREAGAAGDSAVAEDAIAGASGATGVSGGRGISIKLLSSVNVAVHTLFSLAHKLHIALNNCSSCLSI